MKNLISYCSIALLMLALTSAPNIQAQNRVSVDKDGKILKEKPKQSSNGTVNVEKFLKEETQKETKKNTKNTVKKTGSQKKAATDALTKQSNKPCYSSVIIICFSYIFRINDINICFI